MFDSVWKYSTAAILNKLEQCYSGPFCLIPHCLRQFAKVFLLVAGFAAVGDKACNQQKQGEPPKVLLLRSPERS